MVMTGNPLDPDPDRRHAAMRSLRAEGSVVPFAGLDGVVAAVRYDSVGAGLRRVEEFGGSAAQDGLPEADTNIAGMILASHSLDTDSGYRDAAVWSEFLKAYNLPNIDRYAVEGVKEINHDWYSGSYQSITALNGQLTAEQKAALARADGRIK